VGTVGLQGRGAAGTERWIVSLTVTLHAPGALAPTYTFTPTTDAWGQFTITGILPGTYDVQVKKAHTLTNRKTNVALGGTPVPVDLGTLWEGDANEDGIINIQDFSLLSARYGKYCGLAGYDLQVDFNDDCIVNIRDFSLLSSNYLRHTANLRD
jgi:hypothetical protein